MLTDGPPTISYHGTEEMTLKELAVLVGTEMSVLVNDGWSGRGDLALSQECQHKTKILTGKANLQGSWVPPASRLR